MPSVPVTIVGVMTWSGESGGDRPPLQIWGGGNMPVVTPPIYYPGSPAHPIVPGQPPQIWGGPYFPPVVSGPPGPWPTPPIYMPPAGGGSPPLGMWGGGNVPYPTPPIYFPPSPPENPPEPPASNGGGSWHYVPGLGWCFYAEGGKWVFVGGDKPQPPNVPGAGGPVVTPH